MQLNIKAGLNFAAALMVKDVKLSQAAAEATGSPTPLESNLLATMQTTQFYT